MVFTPIQVGVKKSWKLEFAIFYFLSAASLFDVRIKLMYIAQTDPVRQRPLLADVTFELAGIGFYPS